MSMTNTEKGERRQLRLWPGVVGVLLQLFGWFVLPVLVPDFALYGFLGGIVCALLVIVWWAFFSRAPHLERWGAIVLMIVGSVVTFRLIDKSIATGAMGFIFPMYSIPV